MEKEIDKLQTSRNEIPNNNLRVEGKECCVVSKQLQTEQFKPLFNNRFVVEYMGIPEWLVLGFLIGEDNNITIHYREMVGFSPEEIFNKNKAQEKLTLKFLDEYGNTVRKDTFYGCKYKKISLNTPLFYNVPNRELTNSVVLSYKKRNIEIIGGNNIRNASTN